MEDTLRRMAKILGATQVQSGGHDTSFVVQDGQGTQLRVTVVAEGQRLMAVLVDAHGVTRTSLDMAPVSESFEDPATPGRVSLRIGHQLLHLDGQPTIGVEVESLPIEQRGKSQRALRASGEQRAL